MNQTLPHILVVDDHAEIRDLLKRFLEQHGFKVTCARDGKEMKRLLENGHFTLLVLDLMMPGEDGLTLCRDLRARSSLPVVMLTAMGEEMDRIIGLEMGADDYLTKPFSPRELAARVKSVLKRSKPRDNIIQLENDITLYLDRHAVTKKGEEVRLTPNEYKILLCLVNNWKAVVSRDKLIEYINAPDATDRIVDVHVRHLRQKIEDDPKNPAIVKTAHGHGYRLGVKRNA